MAGILRTDAEIFQQVFSFDLSGANNDTCSEEGASTQREMDRSLSIAVLWPVLVTSSGHRETTYQGKSSFHSQSVPLISRVFLTLSEFPLSIRTQSLGGLIHHQGRCQLNPLTRDTKVKCQYDIVQQCRIDICLTCDGEWNRVCHSCRGLSVSKYLVQ